MTITANTHNNGEKTAVRRKKRTRYGAQAQTAVLNAAPNEQLALICKVKIKMNQNTEINRNVSHGSEVKSNE
jgi:hypothetical protein